MARGGGCVGQYGTASAVLRCCGVACLVLVKDVAVHLLIVAVVQVLLLYEVSDVDVAQSRCGGHGIAQGGLPCARCAGYKDVGPAGSSNDGCRRPPLAQNQKRGVGVALTIIKPIMLQAGLVSCP